MKAGWIATTLGEAFITSTGSTPPKSNSDFYGQFMPLVKPPELCDSTLDSAEDGLSESGTQVARTLPPNSILVSCIGNLGKIGMNTVPVAFNQQINAIHPDPGKAVPEFMFFQTLGGRFREQLEAMASGTTVPIVNKSKFNSIEIVLPPLPEQQRIVTLLDEAFDGIATAKAHAEKNLQNARAIFESHLDAVLSRSGAGYTETTLGAEVDLLPGYAFPSGGYTNAADAVRLLRGDNIMQGYFRWEEAKGWSSNDCLPFSKFALQEGDVVIAMDRPWVKAGLKRAQICADDLPSLLVQRTSRLRTLGKMRMDFLSHLTGSQSFSRHLLEVQTGIGVPHISGKQIESFKFMLPPMSDQESIADALNELLSNTQRLEKIYEEKLTALDELKKSLLAQAFSGAL